MAWTVTKTKYAAGNKSAFLLDITTDSAEANVGTGLGSISHYSVGFQSMTTVVGPKMAPNKTSTATAALGTLGCSGFTSGDRFFIVVYGR